MSNVIFVSNGLWNRQTATTIADNLNMPTQLRPMTLLSLFRAAIAGGADAAEFRALWQYSGHVERFEAGLQAGDLAGVQALLATIPVELSEGTMAAVQGVIDANALTAGQANWPEFDENGNPAGDPPAEFTEAWVSDTLTAAGYSWNGNQWVRG